MPRGPRSASQQLVSLLTIAAFTSATFGCGWRQMPITELNANKGSGLYDHQVRLVLAPPEGQSGGETSLTMQVTRVEYPFAYGNVIEREVYIGGKWQAIYVSQSSTAGSTSTASVDLRQVKEIEVYDETGRKIAVGFLTVVGITAAVILAIVLIAVITKSCPLLYVDSGDGMQLVGVPYAGATYRSIQRDDLLPLQSLPPGRVAMKLVNGGLHEIDYTDRVELIVVDHDPSLLALPTPDAQVLLVKPAAAAIKVVDLNGIDRSELVAARDGKAWQTDLTAALREEKPKLREGLEATFARPPEGEKAVLQLAAGNTPWIDLVFANYMSLFGDKLGKYTERWNALDRRAEVLDWRDRQGVDLRVEVFAGGAWKKVTDVPTVGLMRQMAVPLPALDTKERELKVRVSGALGFWAVDELALTTEASPAQPLRLSPVVATDKSGKDQREALGANDGRYNALPETGDALQLGFDLPAKAPGKARTSFFSSSGYYNVGQGDHGKWSPATLVQIGDGPDALARYSLDLFRDYQQLALSSAKRPVLAQPRQ
jgi:hypothetical protein